jgi:hypothetical protein
MSEAMAVNSERVAFLRKLFDTRLAPAQLAWLDGQLDRIAEDSGGRTLALSIGLAPRKLGKGDLTLNVSEKDAIAKLRHHLDLSGWSVDQTARVLFMLASFDGDDAAFAARLDRLMISAEVGEQIALLRGLPLYPASNLIVARAAEGVRSAMQPVFEAVAHRNPFPHEEFSEAQWNQMVVKALFIGSRLAPIQGLDERRNPDLAKMLIDYAHERWAAGRAVSPELWRCVGPFAREDEIADLAKVLREGTAREQQAAALALASCPLPRARSALGTVPSIASSIETGDLTWHGIA